MKRGNARLDAALSCISDALRESRTGWSVFCRRERNTDGWTPMSRTAVYAASPEKRIICAHGVVGGPGDWEGCDGKMLELLRLDGWPVSGSDEETRLRLAAMGPAAAVSILRKYEEDLDRHLASRASGGSNT